MFQEFYIEDKDAIEDLINLFALNSDKFDYQSFMKEKKEKKKKEEKLKNQNNKKRGYVIVPSFFN